MTPEDKAYNLGLREAVSVIKSYSGNKPRGLWLLVIQHIVSKMKTKLKRVHYTVEIVGGKQAGDELLDSLEELKDVINE